MSSSVLPQRCPTLYRLKDKEHIAKQTDNDTCHVPGTNDGVKAKAMKEFKAFELSLAALIVWRKFKMCTLLKRRFY